MVPFYIKLAQLPYLVLRLFIGRDAFVTLDRAFDSVIGRKGKSHITFKFIQQPTQIRHSTPDIITRLKRTADAEPASGYWYELH